MSLALFAIVSGATLAATQGPGFARSVTPGLVERYAPKFGPEARPRIGGWQQFIRSTEESEDKYQGNELELLGPVNAYFNHPPFLTDLAHWGVDDYWASPSEFIGSNGGDCEDFSIAKYFALKELGVPIQRLRITYVKAVRLDQAHMVLAYYATPTSVPLILDNLINEVKPASERKDLIPVYSFNDEDVVLEGSGLRVKNAGASSPVRMWRILQEKLDWETRQ